MRSDSPARCPPRSPPQTAGAVQFRRLVAELRAFQSTTNDQVLRVFLSHDVDRSGGIDVRELRTALFELGLPSESDQAARILRRYDSDQSGTLELAEFRNLVDELRRFQASAVVVVSPGDEVHQMFTRVDADRSGDIDVEELRRALEALGLLTDSRQAAQLLAKYDADASRRLELPEFRTLVSELRRFQSQGGGAAASAHDDVSRIFRKADVDGSGTIDADELHAALFALGMSTDSSQARAILRRYDVDANGTLDAQEFARLVAEIRAFQGHRGGAAATPGDAHDDDQVRRVFLTYDRDRSGNIDVAELRSALLALELAAQSERAHALLANYDADRSGRAPRHRRGRTQAPSCAP